MPPPDSPAVEPPSERPNTFVSIGRAEAEAGRKAASFRALFLRLARGLPLILGLGALGPATAGLIWLVSSPWQQETTSTRVAFSFPGYTQGEYPDHSKFQADDLLAPDVIYAALRRLDLREPGELENKVRGSLTIEGIVPQLVAKKYARQNTSSYAPPPSPNEFRVTLTLLRGFPLNRSQRQRFLNALVAAYQEKFFETFASFPPTYAYLRSILAHADYGDYEQILGDEVRSIENWLAILAAENPTFRSRATDLSFDDLRREDRQLTEIYANEALGLIRMDSITRDRKVALLKMDYQLQVLSEKEVQATVEQQTTRELLMQAGARSNILKLQSRAQSASVGADSILDQGFISSLLANDTYKFMLRQALAAGLRLNDVQSQERRLADRQKSMIGLKHGDDAGVGILVGEAAKSVQALNIAYGRFIADATATYTDFARQKFADAVRITMGPTSASEYRPLAVAGIAGASIGLSIGAALSLLGIGVAKQRTPIRPQSPQIPPARGMATYLPWAWRRWRRRPALRT